MFNTSQIHYDDRTLVSIFQDEIGVGSWMVPKEDISIVIPKIEKLISDLNKALEKPIARKEF